MGLDVDNGRRVLLFERHCWALRDMTDKAKLAFFNAMLDFGSDGTTDFAQSAGIVRTLMPEIVALSETSWHRANARRSKRVARRNAEQSADKRAMRAEQSVNKTGTNAEQSVDEEEEEEKESKDSSTVRVDAHRVPSVDEVLDASERLNWIQFAPGWTLGELKDAVRSAYADLAAAGWRDAAGRPVGNWRTYLCKAVSGKKNFAARALGADAPIGSTEER